MGTSVPELYTSLTFTDVMLICFHLHNPTFLTDDIKHAGWKWSSSRQNLSGMFAVVTIIWKAGD